MGTSPALWLPSPADLGFPPKFESWRDDQLRAVNKVLGSTQRFVALTMPTGAGKGLTYVTAALVQKDVKRALFLTATKGLQDQNTRDFSALGFTDIRGQSNYPCVALQRGAALHRYRHGNYEHRCDEGPCHAGVRCSHIPDRSQPSLRSNCEYYGAVHDATGATLVGTNYSYWLHAGQYSQGIGKFDCVVLDEAHEADKEVESFLTFELTDKDVHRARTKLLDSQEVYDWKLWAKGHVTSLARTIEEEEEHPPISAEGVRDIRELKRVHGKFERLATLDPESWVVDLESGHPVFTPVRVAEFCEAVLFRGIPRVILTSATLTLKTLALLGIKREEATIWECPSSFPVERRPIIHVNPQPEIRVSHKMSDAHKIFWRARIDNLIGPRIDRKGIIHTVSYARMKDLMQHSEYRDFFITHDSGNTPAAVAEFKRQKPPCILLSPSIMTGFDFPDDDARWQIIGKIPLLDTRGIAIQTRIAHDPDYANYVAMQKLVQACGRIVRSPLDWGETFIVDDQFIWFLRRARKFAPRWFHDAVQWVCSLPPVLQVDPASGIVITG
jgi:Rad3-related DNA helicase